jgi:hypothetical protein
VWVLCYFFPAAFAFEFVHFISFRGPCHCHCHCHCDCTSPFIEGPASTFHFTFHFTNMSKFFKAKHDIESDSESESEPEVVPQKLAGNRFSGGYQHDDSDSGKFTNILF